VLVPAIYYPRLHARTHRYTLGAREKAKTVTIRDHTEVIELRNALSKDLVELRQAQRIYMPGLNPLLYDDENADEHVKLWLPSELTQDDREEWSLPGIPGLEFRFRYAQADGSLAEIRRLRRLLQSHLDQKAKHLSHAQQNVTRGKGIFDGVQGRIHRAMMRYRHARHAMMALDPSQQLSPGWARRFRELVDADIRGPGRDTNDKSEGKFQLSWIWLLPHQTGRPPSNKPVTVTPVPDSGATDPVSSVAEDLEVVDSMRVHWAKCQARADRYEEEVALTVEEMGRTLRFFEWRRSQWLSLRSSRTRLPTPPPIEVQRGLHAYSCRQVHVYDTLIVSFVNLWRKFLVPNNLGSEWLLQYPIATDPLSTRPSRGHSRPTAEPDLTPASNVSTQVDSLPPPSPVTLPATDMITDPPMGSDVESGDDCDYAIDEGEESDFEF